MKTKCINGVCKVGKLKVNYGVSCVLYSEIYRGQCGIGHKIGDCHNSVGQVAADILNAKNYNNLESISRLQKLAIKTLKDNKMDWDCVVPISAKNSKFWLAKEIATAIAKELKIPMIKALNQDNTKAKNVQNKNVLLVDDVIFHGTTMRKGAKAILDAGANNVCFYAIASSPRNK